MADSAYDIKPWLITPFRKASGEALTTEQKAFNKHHSGLQVKVEQTIGVWKSRWAFLRCIPNPGNLSVEQMQSIYARIGSSVVWHNLLHIHADDWEWQGRNRQGRGDHQDLEAMALDRDDEELELERRGDRRRWALMNRYIASLET